MISEHPSRASSIAAPQTIQDLAMLDRRLRRQVTQAQRDDPRAVGLIEKGGRNRFQTMIAVKLEQQPMERIIRLGPGS